MVYCQQCGAANDIMSRQCHRCGTALTSESDAVPAATSTMASSRATPESPQAQPSLDIGQGLELPDWLKRAAAETPPQLDSAAPIASHLPPAEFHVAPNGIAEPHASDDDVESGAPPRPLPPVPNADLPSAMPEWLRTPAASAGPESPPLDPADTTSFISENDLPEWIRQIAAADAVKAEESKRLAAETAPGEVAGSVKRPLLPGESAAPSVPATNPWLARREIGSAEQAWGGSAAGATAAPDTGLAPSEPVAVEAAASPEPAPAPKRGISLGKPAMPKPGLDLGGDGRQSKLRTILIAAVVVLLLVLLAGMLL